MQRKIVKYELVDLGIINVPTKVFDEKSRRIKDGPIVKKHAFKVINPGLNSCIVFEENLRGLGISLESVDVIDEEGEVIGRSKVEITKEKLKRTYVRRK